MLTKCRLRNHFQFINNMKKRIYYFSLCFFLIDYLEICSTKYMEGHLKTSESWAFLARFCFLSEDGQFEYRIEFDRNQGIPNLLLYYDTEDQWPSVYKTEKSCVQKESVLRIENNQVVNLTVQYPYNERSGCILKSVGLDYKDPPLFHIPVAITPKPSTKPITYNTTLKELINQSGFGIKWETAFVDSANTTDPSFGNSTGFGNDFAAETFTMNDSLVEEIQTTHSSAITKRSPAKVTRKPKPMSVIVSCHNARRFKSSRERWWFIAVSNCPRDKGIDLRYKLLLTNGPVGDYWHEHFSADEFYVLPVLMTFAVTYSILILAIIMCSVELKARQLLHSTYKMFMVSVFLQFIGIIVKSMALIKYATTGIEASKTIVLAGVLMGFSETVFLLLLLLLAKGFTTTRGRLPITASVKLTVFMCFYSLTYIALFVYEERVFDPGEVLYLYESPAGLGLIILRIIAWCMFIYSTIFTLKKFPEKSNFYYPFNICGTLWFISGPAFILSANAYIDKWVRESVVSAIVLFIAFVGHLMFLILTLPSYANKNFPYHVRTTQIGIMNVATSVDNLDTFQHNPYAPTLEQSVIIPLSRRTEDLCVNMYNGRRNSQVPHVGQIVVPQLFTVSERPTGASVCEENHAETVSNDLQSPPRSAGSNNMDIEQDPIRNTTPVSLFQVPHNKPKDIFTVSGGSNTFQTLSAHNSNMGDITGYENVAFSPGSNNKSLNNNDTDMRNVLKWSQITASK